MINHLLMFRSKEIFVLFIFIKITISSHRKSGILVNEKSVPSTIEKNEVFEAIIDHFDEQN